MASNIQNFIIAIIVVSIGVLGFGVYYSGITTSYGVTTTYNLTNGGSYNQMATIQNLTNTMYVRVSNNNTGPNSPLGGQNILGDYLSYGWNTLKLTFTSYNIFYIILNTALNPCQQGQTADCIPLSDAGTGVLNTIKIAIGSIVMVIFVFAIILFLSGRQQI